MLITATVLISFGAFLSSSFIHGGLEWVRGEYGDKCYPKGTEHANIRHKLYYPTFDACVASLPE